MNELTVFIGRFSPFHNGHADVLSRALLHSKRVLVLIGSAYTSRSIKNPFTFDERADMIEAATMQGNEAKLFIEPLLDYPYNDSKWIAQVQDIVERYRCGATKIHLTGANRDASSWYLKTFGDFFEMDLVEESRSGFSLSATKVRDMYFSDVRGLESMVPTSTGKFLDEFYKTEKYSELCVEYRFIQSYRESWKKAPYAPTFVTVDAVVIQSGHVLVVERDAQPGRGLWALPGGFIEQSERIQDACVRELLEETRIGLSNAQLYGSIVDREVFDHPDRSMRGRTITHAFLFRLKDTVGLPKVKPQAGEVRRVMWVPLAKAIQSTEHWFEDHHAIMSTMLDRV